MGSGDIKMEIKEGDKVKVVRKEPDKNYEFYGTIVTNNPHSPRECKFAVRMKNIVFAIKPTKYNQTVDNETITLTRN